MTILEFISKGIDSLAWPLVFVVLIFLLRKPISDILPFLERLKYKDFELSFRRQAQETLDSLAKNRDTPLETSKKQLTSSPREAVIQAWIEIVEAAETKYKQLEPSQRVKKLGPDRALGYFQFMGLLVPQTVKVLSELRNLRNQAVHYSDAAISIEGAQAYVSAAEMVKKQIESINNVTPIKLTHLSHLLLEINAVIDTGKYDHISIEDVHREIENGTILRFIAKEAYKDIDLSLLLDRGDDELNFERHYVRHLQSIYGGYAGQERRKWGVENKGLCLLVAWTMEIIQQGSGWQSNEEIAQQDA
nr:hypothetical protein [uncultured Desulfuromonas sp.]